MAVYTIGNQLQRTSVKLNMKMKKEVTKGMVWEMHERGWEREGLERTTCTAQNCRKLEMEDGPQAWATFQAGKVKKKSKFGTNSASKMFPQAGRTLECIGTQHKKSSYHTQTINGRAPRWGAVCPSRFRAPGRPCMRKYQGRGKLWKARGASIGDTATPQRTTPWVGPPPSSLSPPASANLVASAFRGSAPPTAA